MTRTEFQDRMVDVYNETVYPWSTVTGAIRQAFWEPFFDKDAIAEQIFRMLPLLPLYSNSEMQTALLFFEQIALDEKLYDRY